MMPISRNGRPAAACSKMRRAISARRAHQCDARIGARSRSALLVIPDGADAFCQVARAECEGDLGVSIESCENPQLGIGQRVKTIQPDGADTASAFRAD